MQRLEVSGAVRPIYGSLGVKRFINTRSCNYSLRGPDDGCQHLKHVELPTEM